MTRFGKYCRTLLAGSLIFGGAVAISVVGASLSASEAAAATQSHSVISLAGPLRLKELRESLLPTLGASGNVGLGGSLDLPEGGKSETSGWAVQKSANVLAKQGLLDTDSCGSASSCMAVGDYLDKAGIQETQAESSIGSTWSVQKLPKTPADQGSAFYDVSCTSSTACTAVGAYRNSSGVQVNLAEAWNGTSWSIETTPNPTGATASVLEGVSCTSASKCIAVGGSEDSSGIPTTLVEQRKGNSWSIVSSPNPSGAQGSVLDGVSCISASACTAVGKYIDSSDNEDTLAEVLLGTSWTIETTPNPSGAQTSFLNGVSCTPAGSCSAVGIYVDSSGAEEALAEELNGGSWSVETVPNPSGEQQSTLGSVACTPGGTCTAVGGYIESSGPEMTLAEGWNGTGWSVESTPNPAGSQGGSLAGVACDSAGACTAAGQYLNSSIVGLTLAEVWNGASWSIQTTPNSKGLSQSSEFLGVACTSSSACTAVGTSAAIADAALAEAWNGTKWSIQTTPVPSGSRGSVLYGVACASATACTAVGGYENSSGAEYALAEASNGTSWSIKTTPTPSGAEDTVFSAVTCTSATACTAVGDYTDSGGNEDTLAEAWNGASWSIETTPNPTGEGNDTLNGVSCTSASACTAVGDYTDNSDTQDTLAEAWNGTVWSIETTPNPAGEGDDFLNSVSCTSANACTAVGDYDDNSDTQDTLAEAWNGTVWSIETTPNPAGPGGSTLSGVSCTSVNACTAVGEYLDSAGYFAPLAEAWSGASWSIQATPLPAGVPEGDLSGVACTSGGCTAAGSSDSISGAVLTLVEVES